MSSHEAKGSVHALPVSRASEAGAQPPLSSPKQEMLQALDTLRARVETGLVTGIQLYAGTRLGEPLEDLAVGSFAQAPLDTALLVTHGLYRRLYALKEAELADKTALARRLIGY